MIDPNTAVSLGLMLTTIGGVWKVSALAAKLQAGLDRLGDELRRVEEKLKELAQIPIHAHRLEALERHASDMDSRVANVIDHVSNIDRKIAVTREKLSSVSNEIGLNPHDTLHDHDSDPPAA